MLVMKSGEKPNLENYSVFFETLIIEFGYALAFFCLYFILTTNQLHLFF
jgi:hypothetical protein